MQVYKYRSNYDLDLKLLSRSKIYAPNKHLLNDPFEGIVISKIFDDYELIKPYLSPSNYEYRINLVKKLLVQIGYLGIYSLSKTWNNELLWVHYSNSHKGFCIEYELDDLLLGKTKTVIFPEILEIEYSKKPPIYSLDGMDKIDKKQLLNILIGTKSIPWKYEKEVRVLFKDNGEQDINDKAIKSIIFGAHASDENINKTIIQMTNKLKYYKIEIADNYKLIRKGLKYS